MPCFLFEESKIMVLKLVFPRAPNTETKKVRSWGVFRGLRLAS